MLSFTGNLKIFVALEPVDLRKSFNGLEALVSGRLGEDLRAGALFVFTNRSHILLKCAVRKAQDSSGRVRDKTHPATFAPAGSSQGGRGGNEAPEAFDVKGS